MGGTKKKGEKKLKLDEFLPIFSQCKKDKEQGCYEDFLECLKLYDKQEDGTMLAAELSHTLLSLGKSNFQQSFEHKKVIQSIWAYVKIHFLYCGIKCFLLKTRAVQFYMLYK